LLNLRKFGYADTTLEGKSRKLKFLAKHADLDDPEAIIDFVGRLAHRKSSKMGLVNAYNNYVKFHGLTWTKPVYRAEAKMPRIPLERIIDDIIANAEKHVLAFRLMKEHGLRPIEVVRLKVRDLDLSQGMMYPETAKYGSGRSFKLKQETLALLKGYVARHCLGLDDRLYCSVTAIRKAWIRARKKAYNKTNNPEYLTVRLYDLRHFFASMLYYKTKDIVYVKQQLGHRRLENTMKYVQLVKWGDEEFTCKVAKTLEEAMALVEQGFEYITDMESVKIFRKRK